MNLWIVHAEENLGQDSFEDFVKKIINSDVRVQVGSAFKKKKKSVNWRSFLFKTYACNCQERYGDDFRRCLSSRGCLSGGPSRLLSCLRGDCPAETGARASELARCLVDDDGGGGGGGGGDAEGGHGGPHLPPPWLRYLQLAECLSGPLAEFEVQWQLGDAAFHFGTEEGLRVWEST